MGPNDCWGGGGGAAEGALAAGWLNERRHVDVGSLGVNG